jgi:hypothetical protein
MESYPDAAPRDARTGLAKTKCNKKGGVCSIRAFHPDTPSPGELSFGRIAATCPVRFIQQGVIFREIGKAVLGTDNPLLVKELPFLRRVVSADPSYAIIDEEAAAEPATAEIGDAEDVGRIDMVLVHPDTDRLNWCAVELQAVYFSGGEMGADFAAIKAHTGEDIPLPAKARRPDFRSSGPKRLMPQLQIKVPTLRRWGRRMAVVIDEAFFASLGPMDNVPDVSNADIIWVVVGYDEGGLAETPISVKKMQFSTLERAVEGLTAGTPTSLGEFEQRLLSKLHRPTAAVAETTMTLDELDL